MSDLPLELPEIQDQVLDAPTLAQLFADLARDAKLIAIVVKGPGLAEGGPQTLEQARELLAEGAVRGVQLRYLHGGTEWWDTLMVVPGGVRLVRIGHAPTG
ncbi:MAG: hypothetical protein Q8Q09_09130 [Deltaproteobacteria bacterium]|nr:hypothetical protein [Deltaproteobacteria bacterium]